VKNEKTQVVRDAFPDVLRGFALLGIAVVNIPYLSLATEVGATGEVLRSTADYGAAFFVMALFQAKFYLLFSFLFGYSSHYVIKGDRSNKRRWIARAAGLIILGVLHFSLLFHGDILFLYGVFGLLLLAFYFRKDRTLKIWAWVLFVLGSLLLFLASAALFAGEIFLASKGKALPVLEPLASLDNALSSGSFLDTVPARVELWLAVAPQAIFLQGPFVFVAFLVGVLVARRSGLSSAGVSRKLMVKLATWGFIVGLPLQFVSALIFVTNEASENYSAGLYLLAVSLNFVGAPIMSAGYVGGLWLLHNKLNTGWSLLTAAGRHSLSVYLGQSLVFSILFSAWGFGLFGKLGVVEITLIAGMTWLGLALLAKLNMRYRTSGPMETVLTKFSKLFGGGK
jgi:uncharacterized protein